MLKNNQPLVHQLLFLSLMLAVGCGDGSGGDLSNDLDVPDSVTSDTSSDQNTHSSTDSDASSDTGSDASSDTGSDASSDTGSDTGPDTGADTDSNDDDADLEAAKARVSDFIDANTTGFWCRDNVNAEGTRDAITEAIVKTCREFSPKQSDFDVTWCEAHLVAASCKESSMQARANFNESMANPPVGLLQNRFGSTVQDYNNVGPKDAIARIGCPWPDFSGVSDWGNPTDENLEWLQTIPCNIALGAWYYYFNATGNGTPPVWAWNYCNGEGTSANLVVGLLCHLQGANAISYDASNPWNSPYDYVSTIREYFDLMITPTPDPHPFLRELHPNVTQYCEQ